MDDTIAFKANSSFEQIFRITYKKNDYYIKLISGIPEKNTSQIDVFLDGLVRTLIKHNGKWNFSDTDADQDFANDIGRAISLRFRL